MKQRIVAIILILITPFILGMSIDRIQTRKFDGKAVSKLVNKLNKNCSLKETSYVPQLHKCTRDDQVAYYLECTDGRPITVCCGLMKECKVSLK